MIHGRNLIVAIDGVAVGGAKSCTVSKSQSFIEVASPTDGQWESFIPQKRGWKISANCLIGTLDAYKALDQAWKAGTALTIRFYDTEYNENETGTAYIENLELQANIGSLAQMSVSLRGSGELSTYTSPITVSRSLQQDAKFYYPTQGGNYSVNNYSNSAKIYTGSFTLSKRTLVQISGMRTGNNSLVFLSTNNGIITKAQNAETIYGSDYNSVIRESGKIWLNAGTWYVVESSQNYITPSYDAISL
jgi:predicted secreted protein